MRISIVSIFIFDQHTSLSKRFFTASHPEPFFLVRILSSIELLVLDMHGTLRHDELQIIPKPSLAGTNKAVPPCRDLDIPSGGGRVLVALETSVVCLNPIPFERQAGNCSHRC